LGGDFDCPANPPLLIIRRVGSMVKTRPAASEEQNFIVSSLPPTRAQKRLALGVVLILLAAFFITAGPLSTIQLARIDAFIPIYATAMFVNDSVTAVLLFAQFSILRSSALLAISSGYLFTAFMLIPWMLTFPGVFAPSGLLGAGLQSTAWLYIVWHAGFPIFVIAYALLKERDPTKRFWSGPVFVVILSRVAMTAGIVCVAALFVTAGHEQLPALMRDTVHLAPLWPYAAGFASLLSVLAAVVLWVRRRSVLDLWLMVVMCAFVIEMCLISFPVPARFSVGWYAGRIFGVISGSLVLFVLLYEITTLYARLVDAVSAQRREREARLMTGDTVSASIAHEINQPLAAIVNNASACLRWLAANNMEEARISAELIRADGHRAGEIIGRIRALAKKAPPQKEWLDINETIREVIALAQSELQRNGIALETRLSDDVHYVPLVFGDRIQLQQVILNLIINAIEAMSVPGDGPRELLVQSGTAESQRVLVAVSDSGPGLDPKSLNTLFDAFYTTKPQGLGMGLAICRSIIDAHGGRLWATANDSRGATFQFILPTGSERTS